MSLNPGAPVPGAGALVTLNEQVKRVSMDNARKSRDDEVGPDGKHGETFVLSHGLSSAEAEELLKKWGRNELVEKVTPTWLIVFRLVMFDI